MSKTTGFGAKFRGWLSKPGNREMLQSLSQSFGSMSSDPYGSSRYGEALGAAGEARSTAKKEYEDREEERKRRMLEEQRESLRQQAFQSDLVRDRLKDMEEAVNKNKTRQARDEIIKSTVDLNDRNTLMLHRDNPKFDDINLDIMDRDRARAEAAGDRKKQDEAEEVMINSLPPNLQQQARIFKGTGDLSSFVRETFAREHSASLRDPDEDDDEMSLSERMKIAGLDIDLDAPRGKTSEQLIADLEQRALQDPEYRDSDQLAADLQAVHAGTHPGLVNAEEARLSQRVALGQRVPEMGFNVPRDRAALDTLRAGVTDSSLAEGERHPDEILLRKAASKDPTGDGAYIMGILDQLKGSSGEQGDYRQEEKLRSAVAGLIRQGLTWEQIRARL